MIVDSRQFDMFTTPAPEPIDLAARHTAALLAWEPANMVGRDKFGRPQVQTRAASHDGIITLYDPEAPAPIEVEVRGTPCVLSFHGGYATHAVEPAGSLFWSETGFRSMGRMLTDPAEIIADIERYINAPARDGSGCGGKLLRWWPSYVRQWQQSLAFELQSTKECGREGVWDQWGPEAWEDHWHRHDMKLADAIEQMREDGINPNDVGPPHYFKGKWPSPRPPQQKG